jgi:hypothetical protein
MDVDIVIYVQLLADTQAYATLEENFRRMGFDLYQVTSIQADLLGEGGVTTEDVRHADLVSFDERTEGYLKDGTYARVSAPLV